MSIVNAYYAYSFRNEYAKNSTRFLLSSLSIFVVWTLFSILDSPFVLFRHLPSLACSVGIVVKRAEILQSGAVAEMILILLQKI